MKRIIIIIVIIFGAGIAFYFFRKNAPQTPKEHTNVYRGTLQEKLTLSGKIDADQKVTLRFQTAGRLASIAVKEGDIVRKNQLIATLDERQLQNTLQQQLNTYLNSRWNFDQVKSDNQSTADAGATQIIRERAKRLIDESQFSLNNTVLGVEAQSLAIEFSHLTTPIAGIVTRIASPIPGVAFSVPTQAEFDVVNPSTIYFEALADQTEVTKLRQSEPADIVLDAFPDSTVSAAISSISFTPKTDEVGTVYPIHLQISDTNDQYTYRLGMTGDVTFTTQEKNNVLILPTKFIKGESGNQTVTVMQDGKYITKHISTGLENDTETEITSGLAENDIVYD